MIDYREERTPTANLLLPIGIGAILCALFLLVWKTLSRYNSFSLVLFGLLVSVLTAFLVYQFRKTALEAERAREAKILLEVEIRERRKTDESLQHTLVRTDLATKAAHMGVWTWDLASGKLNWNERMFELMGVPTDVKPTYEVWLAHLHPDDAAHIESLLKKTVQGLAVFDTEFRIQLKNKSVRHIRAAARVLKDGEGQAQTVTGLNWDITDSKLEQAALKKSEEQVRLLLNSTGEAIYGIDMDGNCTFANPSCLRMTGFRSLKDVLGKNMHDLIHHSWSDGRPMDVRECHIFRAFREGLPAHIDDEVLWRSDGTSFPAEYWSYPQTVDGTITGAVVTFIDITERKRAAEQIQHMATHDALTDLPSLRLARDRLTMALGLARRNKKMTAVMFVDLDGFKAVNDTYGHDAGDEVLKQVSKRLSSVIRETDTVARIGGDEFLLVITELTMADYAANIADKILSLLKKPIAWKGNEPRVGASIGIALYPRDADTINDLIKLADEAMYAVKMSGKNGYGFAKHKGSA